MRAPAFASLFSVALLAGCLSQEEPVPVRLFEPVLPALEGAAVPGTHPLRFDPVTAPAHLKTSMLWRVESNELASDEQHLWAEEPARVLDRRLRDLLFGGGGYRDSVRGADPQLDVELVACEGDLEGSARVEVIVELTGTNDVAHRARLVELEPMPSVDAEGLAAAGGNALARLAQRCFDWVEARL